MSGNLLGMIAQGGTDPFQRIGSMVNTARGATALQQQRFDLQQAQLQPTFMALNSVQNDPNLNYDQINAILGQARRLGANTDGMVQNMTEMSAAGMKPQDFARIYAMRGINPTIAFEAQQPTAGTFQTPYGTAYGTWSPGFGGAPGRFTQNPQQGGAMPPGAPAPMQTVRGGGNLASIVANLESGGGRDLSTPGAVDPVYGQLPGFVNQYGSGAAGVANYANQVLQANPNATLGDFYSGYVLGTGDPANTPGIEALRTTNVKGAQGAYRNLIANAGVPASTPLAALMGGGTQLAAAEPTATSFATGTTPQGGLFSNFGQNAPAAAGGPAVGAPFGPYAVPPGSNFVPTVPPWVQQGWDASSKQWLQDTQMERTLPERMAPLTQAMSLLNAHPDLATGPGQQEFNSWVTAINGISHAMGGGDIMTQAWTGNASDWQELSKKLYQNIAAAPGANHSDLMRLQSEMTNPNPQMQRKAIMDLAGTQMGLMRMQVAGVQQFRQMLGNNPQLEQMYSNQYWSSTNQFMQRQDPMAWGANDLPQDALRDYRSGLRTDQQKQRFDSSLEDAIRLGAVSPTPPGSQ